MVVDSWNAIVKFGADTIATLIQFKDDAIAKIIELYTRFVAWIQALVADATEAIWNLPGNIVAAMEQVRRNAVGKAEEIYNGVKGWFDKIVGFFNEIIGKAGEAINKAREAFSIGQKAGYSKQTGGIVPGPIGMAVPILAHAGERVTPSGLSGGHGGGGITFNVTIGLYAGTETEKRNVAKELYGALAQLAQSQNKSVKELMGA